MRRYIQYITIATALLCSCSEDDARYTNIAAELCMLPTKNNTASYLLTDKGEKLDFTNQITFKSSSKADTTYRAMVHYNKEVETNLITPLSVDIVPVLTAKAKKDVPQWEKMTDPIVLRSSWISQNGAYVNLDIGLPSGTPEGNSKHVIALVAETTPAKGRHLNHRYILCHNQNNIPEYYTNYTYISIPLSDIQKDDTITLRIPTKKGMIEEFWIK